MSRSDRARLGVRMVFGSLAVSFALQAIAQIDTAPVEGLRENSSRAHALTNARVFVRPGVELELATIVVRDGIIEAVGDPLESGPTSFARSYRGGRSIYRHGIPC